MKEIDKEFHKEPREFQTLDDSSINRRTLAFREYGQKTKTIDAENTEQQKKKKRRKLLFLATSAAVVSMYLNEGAFTAVPAVPEKEPVIESKYSINGKQVPFEMPYYKDLIEVLETEDYMEAIFAAVDFYEKQGLPTYETMDEKWENYMSRNGKTYDKDFLEFQAQASSWLPPEGDYYVPSVSAYETYVMKDGMAYDWDSMAYDYWDSVEHKPEGYRKLDTMFVTYQSDKCADGSIINEVVLYWSDTGLGLQNDWALSITIFDYIDPSGELGSYHVTLVAGESDEQGMAVNPIYYEGEIDKSTGETYIYKVDASAMNGKDALEYEAVESIPYKRYHGYRGALELESSGIGHHAIYWFHVAQPGNTFEYIVYEE